MTENRLAKSGHARRMSQHLLSIPASLWLKVAGHG